MSTHALSLQLGFGAMTSKLLGLGVELMSSLARKWGCVPHTVLQFIKRDRSDVSIKEWYRSHAHLAVLKSTEMMNGILQNTLVDDAPSQIFFCRP